MRTLTSLVLCGGVVLASLVRSAPASAQEPPGAAKPAPPSDQAQADARKQFDAGVSLLEDPDGAKYEDAYRAFKKAYELSQSPKVLGNIAFCALHLERDGEAIDSYTTYLREVPDVSERERQQIQRDLQTMIATTAKIHVVRKAASPGTTIVDRRAQTRGQPVENVYPYEGAELVLRVRPGRHTLIVKNGNVESLPADVTVEPGGDATVTPQDKPIVVDSGPATAPSTQGGSRSVAGPIVLGSLGLAGIVVGVATGITAKNKTNDIEKACPNDACPGTYNLADARSSAKTFGTIADIGFIGGGVMIAGAAVWYLVTPKEGRAAPAPPPGTGTTLKTVRPSAMCTGTGCAAFVGGEF